MPPSIRPALTLITGLAIGVAGAVLFIQSMPPREGSAAERVEKLELDLKRARNQLASLEGADPDRRQSPKRTFRDGARRIAEDIRDGKAVTPDDIFHATQPLLRDLNPLLSRIRLRDLHRRIDTMTGEIARKYNLDSTQQESLKQWFEQKAIEENKRYDEMISQDGTRLEDIIQGTRDIRPDEGLDAFMEGTLRGGNLAAFKSDRMLERVGRVQQEADMKVTRLDGIVKLDEAQHGQVFGIMARGSRDFDPNMQFEGLGTAKAALSNGQSKQDAIMAVLRPEQRQAYQAEREKRRLDAQKELEAIGLSMPDHWDALDPQNF
jgi:hypothetical protein